MQIARISFFGGISFLVCAYAVGMAGDFWTYAFSPEAGVLVNLATRVFWALGSLSLICNLFIMWHHAYKNEKWAWFFSLFVTSFVGSLIYYVIEYKNDTANNN